MGEKSGVTVKIAKEEAVRPAIPAAQNHWLPLSNLDQVFGPQDVALYFCYHIINTNSNGIMTFGSMLNVMKTALSETLVSYYPLAGEILENRDGEPELLCNNGGVGFIEAYANVELHQLDLYKVDESIGRLMPRKKHGVAAIQVTELKCGSVVVTCLFDHRISDAYSGSMFISSWAEYARTKTMSVVPNLRRSLLNPRLPIQTNKPMPVICPRSPPTEELQQQDQDDDNRFEGRMYYIKSGKIASLQSRCCSDGRYNTKFEAFVAFLWKLVAKCSEEDDKVVSHMGIIVDGRRMVNPSDDKMRTYFGNVLSCPLKGHKVKDLIGNPLIWVANEVHQVIEHAATKDHFMDLIDHIQGHRPKPITFTIFGMDETALVVSSGLQFEAWRVDFGWGSPVLFSGYYSCWSYNSGMAFLIQAATANGDWIVYMTLKKRKLDAIEEEAADTFVPLATHHLLPQARY